MHLMQTPRIIPTVGVRSICVVVAMEIFTREMQQIAVVHLVATATAVISAATAARRVAVTITQTPTIRQRVTTGMEVSRVSLFVAIR